MEHGFNGSDRLELISSDPLNQLNPRSIALN